MGKQALLRLLAVETIEMAKILIGSLTSPDWAIILRSTRNTPMAEPKT